MLLTNRIVLLLVVLLAGCGEDQSELDRLKDENSRLRAENLTYSAEMDHLRNMADTQAAHVEVLKQDVEELHVMLANSWPPNCDEYGFVGETK